MAHIFFERLENRRSTQSLWGIPSVQMDNYQMGTNPSIGLLYGVLNPSIDNFSANTWNYMPNNSYSMWGNSFIQPSSWANPISNFSNGIGNFVSPLFNTPKTTFDWPQSTSINTYPINSLPIQDGGQQSSFWPMLDLSNLWGVPKTSAPSKPKWGEMYPQGAIYGPPYPMITGYYSAQLPPGGGGFPGGV